MMAPVLQAWWAGCVRVVRRRQALAFLFWRLGAFNSWEARMDAEQECRIMRASMVQERIREMIRARQAQEERRRRRGVAEAAAASRREVESMQSQGHPPAWRDVLRWPIMQDLQDRQSREATAVVAIARERRWAQLCIRRWEAVLKGRPTPPSPPLPDPGPAPSHQHRDCGCWCCFC